MMTPVFFNAFWLGFWSYFHLEEGLIGPSSPFNGISTINTLPTHWLLLVLSSSALPTVPALVTSFTLVCRVRSGCLTVQEMCLVLTSVFILC